MRHTIQTNPENELIRLLIDNSDKKLTDEQVQSIIEALSKYTSRLSRKYKISNEKFKLVTGRSFFERIFKLA